MADIRKTVLISMLLGILFTCRADSFSCADVTAEECKAQFDKTFDEEFKRIYVAAIKKVFGTYAEATRELSEELPKDAEYAKASREFYLDLESELKKLDENIDKNEELIDILKRSFNDFNFDIFHYDEMPEYAEQFKKIIEKYKLENLAKDSLIEAFTQTTNKWNELYATLTAKGLETSASTYAKIDEDMKNTETGVEFAKKIGHALKTITQKLDAPFLKDSRLFA